MNKTVTEWFLTGRCVAFALALREFSQLPIVLITFYGGLGGYHVMLDDGKLWWDARGGNSRKKALAFWGECSSKEIQKISEKTLLKMISNNEFRIIVTKNAIEKAKNYILSDKRFDKLLYN